MKYCAATVTYKENLDISLIYIYIFQEWGLELSLRVHTVAFLNKFYIDAPTHMYCYGPNMKY